jgi:hypothetical protein
MRDVPAVVDSCERVLVLLCAEGVWIGEKERGNFRLDVSEVGTGGWKVED